MKLNEFNANYIYQTDKDKFGRTEVWEVLELESDGYYKGDCESYCLTLIDKVDGFKDMKLYYCKLNGVGHCIGELDGKWIDCNTKQLVRTLPDNYKEIRQYWKIEVVWKKITTKVFGFVPFVR